jgi:hypothetical protein
MCFIRHAYILMPVLTDHRAKEIGRTPVGRLWKIPNKAGDQ